MEVIPTTAPDLVSGFLHTFCICQFLKVYNSTDIYKSNISSFHEHPKTLANSVTAEILSSVAPAIIAPVLIAN